MDSLTQFARKAPEAVKRPDGSYDRKATFDIAKLDPFFDEFRAVLEYKGWYVVIGEAMQGVKRGEGTKVVVI